MQTLPDFSALPDEAYVRLPTILNLLPISTASWWRGIQKGKYPKQVRLGDQSVAWKVKDIRALMASLDSAQ